MPFAYTIDVDRDVVFVLAEGTITDEELLAVVRAYTSDPRYHPAIRVFSDYSAVTHNGLTALSVRGLAKMVKPAPDSRRAVFVNELVAFGMVRMYQAYCQAHEMSYPVPFYSRAEALEYLNAGVPSERVIR
jgi:hypothetical protein